MIGKKGAIKIEKIRKIKKEKKRIARAAILTRSKRAEDMPQP